MLLGVNAKGPKGPQVDVFESASTSPNEMASPEVSLFNPKTLLVNGRRRDQNRVLHE